MRPFCRTSFVGGIRVGLDRWFGVDYSLIRLERRDGGVYSTPLTWCGVCTPVTEERQVAREIDRRKFLTYTGAAGAATGAAWVAPSVLGATQAFAAGSCQETHQINWTQYPAGDFEWGPNQQTQSFTLTPTIFPTTQTVPYDITMTVTQVGVFNNPQAEVDASNFGALNNTYRLWMEGSSASTFGWDVTFTWPPANPAYKLNLTLTVIDEDKTNAPDGYRDRVYLAPEPDDYGSSSKYIGGSGTSGDPWRGQSGIVVPSSTSGNVGASYLQSTSLNSVTISYRGDSTLYGALQSIGINNLTWCP